MSITMMKFALPLALVILAILIGQYYPVVGGVVAMLPTKAVAYALALYGDPDKLVLHQGVQGMLLGTLGITVPFLLILWWLTKL